MENSIQFNLADVPLFPESFRPAFNRLVAGNTQLPDGFGQHVLLGLFIIFLISYVIVSASLFYHWYAYGMKNKNVFIAEVLFSFVSIFLLVTAYQLI